VGQELSFNYTLVPIMAEALEQAGTTDRKVIRDVLAKMDIQDVMATRHIPGQGMAFDETGRIAEKYRKVLLIQWQSGKPVVVFPPELAEKEPVWGN
jgi:branched-chain amino acid transport system substrate-binding protein